MEEGERATAEDGKTKIQKQEQGECFSDKVTVRGKMFLSLVLEHSRHSRGQRRRNVKDT